MFNRLIFVVLLVGLVGCSVSSEEPVVFTKSSSIVYYPPEPSPPDTFKQSLAFVTLDKQQAYTVHGVACDRDTLYDMFPLEARFYALNVTQVWFWGDGTSSTGSSFTHTYPTYGTYFLSIHHNISFRGGQQKQVVSEVTLTIPEPLSDPVLSFNSVPEIVGTTDMELSTVAMWVSNSGGRMVEVEPCVRKISGTIDDISWIRFDPKTITVPNDGQPVDFDLVLDWPNAPSSGSINLSVNFIKHLFTQGWYVPWSP